MEYYGEPTIKKLEYRLCEYLRCDRCHKKITDKEKYYNVHTLDIDSIDDKEICENCINKFTADYLDETKESSIARIEIEPKVFEKNSEYYGTYTRYIDKLAEEDKREF